MKALAWRLVAAICVCMAATPTFAQMPPAGKTWDTRSDTWSAVDGLGRTVVTAERAGPPRKNRTVGIFYFLWLGPHVQGGPYDVTKILAKDPDAMRKPESPLWGPLLAPHHWGEPLFGYYLTNDAYVLRKHAQMLSDAGVDFVAFDVTNQLTYRDYYMTLLKVWSEVRAAGGKTPQVAFLCPFWQPAKVAKELYHDLYQPGLYPDLWFRWEGKPLILADPALLGDADAGMRSFFTFRKPQPDYFQGPTKPDMWSWLEVFPQHVFRNTRGEKEQMSVGVAQNAVDHRLATLSEPGARGRTWHNGRRDTRPNAVRYGLNFAEQFERALKEDPRVVFITGWNEWIAGRFAEFNGVKMPVMFVDEFNQEFSRDIEPMAFSPGGHGDDYYYQMVSFIRRFKGVRPVETAPGPSRIRIDGQFDDWKAVRPEYRDNAGDLSRRDHPGWNNVAHYTNRTGRNDFVLMKAAYDRQNLYFYARTRDPISPREGNCWMTLFLHTGHPGPSWEGFDFVVNRAGRDGTATVERSLGGWNWKRVAAARYRVSGCEMEVAVPRSVLGLAGRQPLQFDFKWADNVWSAAVPEGNVMAFIVNGDTAPNNRFRYPFRTGSAR